MHIVGLYGYPTRPGARYPYPTRTRKVVPVPVGTGIRVDSAHQMPVIGCLHDPANVQLYYSIWQQTSRKLLANFQHYHVYFEYICWKFAGRLLDHVNTPLIFTGAKKDSHTNLPHFPFRSLSLDHFFLPTNNPAGVRMNACRS